MCSILLALTTRVISSWKIIPTSAGTGTVRGNVDLSGSSGFAPGNAQAITFAPNTLTNGPYQGLSVGTAAGFNTLTINGTVTLNPSSGVTNLFHLSSNATQNALPAPNDMVVINGSLINSTGDLTSTITFDFEDTGFFTTAAGQNVYTLITETSGNLATQFSLSQFAAIDVWNGGAKDSVSYFMFGPGGQSLQFVLVPEPATWGLLAGGAMLLMSMRRKRKLASVAKADANTQA